MYHRIFKMIKISKIYGQNSHAFKVGTGHDEISMYKRDYN